jgi:hypothetical protein
VATVGLVFLQLWKCPSSRDSRMSCSILLHNFSCIMAFVCSNMAAQKVLIVQPDTMRNSQHQVSFGTPGPHGHFEFEPASHECAVDPVLIIGFTDSADDTKASWLQLSISCIASLSPASPWYCPESSLLLFGTGR